MTTGNGYKRMTVVRWDKEFIHGTITDGDGHTEHAKVSYTTTAGGNIQDWSYMTDLLKEGAQINIINPRTENGITYPGLLILHPDYLVDISAVANCFETYATSPIIHLINKIKPSANTEATLLGNFAGQLLDEELRGDTLSYNDSATTFYRNNTLRLITADVTPQFHTDANEQKNNIHHAISEELPQTVDEYDSGKVMVEPSFFSEMLGLQGRMDFFQLDHRVIIEQKSGKCGFPQQSADTPVVATKHYIQILLYMALLRYNYRRQYERNNRQLHSFLLYSKYKNSLLPVAFNPQLMFEALKVRNGIAYSEIFFSDGGIRMLASLTPEKLNKNHTSGILWNHYQRPQLEELLAPIHHASPTERAYYIRFLTFIEKEHLLAKVGSGNIQNPGFAATWLYSLDEKLVIGNIYSNLTLTSPSACHTGKVETITLQFCEQTDNNMSNFRQGDIVILYPYHDGEVPDMRRTMVFRCTIDKITADNILLRLRVSQSSAYAFLENKDSKWAIEHDFFESSFGSLYRGMHSFLSAPQERKDLLMLKRHPLTDTSLTLKGNYGEFQELSLRVRQAQDLFLIIGPPGTGKTSYGLVNTLKEELLHDSTSVLLLSYTNRAIDEICSKLIEESIDFIRIGSVTSCPNEYHPFLLENKTASCNNVKALRQLITSTRVFVGTTTSFNSHIAIFSIKQFSLAVIDEASQILEPHLMGILCAVNNSQPAVKKIVMIGDHKQLPAVVQQSTESSKVDDPLLNGIQLSDCRISLFERLLRKYRNDQSVTYMLTRQGRMHHDIAEFPNHAFYGGTLREVPLPHQLRPLQDSANNSFDKHITDSNGNITGIDKILASSRVAFINVDAPTDSPSDKVNQPEADIIAAIVATVYRHNPKKFKPTATVGVIVPYRNQIATVSNAISRYGIDALNGITIDTVERYQGSQRDCIIYGFTVQKPYQLDFLTDNTFEEDGKVIDRKLNVAMTRARESLIIIGNASLLSTEAVFRNLIDFTKEKGSFFHDSEIKI